MNEFQKKCWETTDGMPRCFECPAHAEFPAYDRPPWIGRCAKCEAKYQRDSCERAYGILRKIAELLPQEDTSQLETYEEFADRAKLEIAVLRKSHEEMTKIKNGGMVVIESPFIPKNELWMSLPPKILEHDPSAGIPDMTAITFMPRPAAQFVVHGIGTENTYSTSAKDGKRTVKPIHESGAGLVAKFKDVTTAAKPEQEPVTCDLGADYE